MKFGHTEYILFYHPNYDSGDILITPHTYICASCFVDCIFKIHVFYNCSFAILTSMEFLSCLKAFALAVPSAWNCLPLSICVVHSLTLFCFLLLHNKLPKIYWLKLTEMYCLIVSVGQEFGHGLAGSSTQGLNQDGDGPQSHQGLSWGSSASKRPPIVAESVP